MVSNDSQHTKLQRVHLPMLLFAFLSPTLVSELFRVANFTKGGLWVPSVCASSSKSQLGDWGSAWNNDFLMQEPGLAVLLPRTKECRTALSSSKGGKALGIMMRIQMVGCRIDEIAR